jgi:hypothetical protein
MDEHELKDTSACTIAYIALVLRYIRKWFFDSQRNAYGQFKIRWHFNIGIPSPGYNDQNLKDMYLRIARGAWMLSVTEGTITFKKAKDKFYVNQNGVIDIDIEMDDINVIPEIAAEVVGYAKSTIRENGLHVLIDIGASTLDISGFVLDERDGKTRYNFLTTDLEKLGTFFCNQERVSKIRAHLDRWFAHLQEREDLVIPIPQTIEDYFPKLSDFGKDGEKIVNDDFYKKCRSLIHRTLRALKKDRDSLSEKWREGLPIFLCGGGKFVEIYHYVMEDLEKFWKTSMETNGFRFLPLPVPGNLNTVNFDGQGFDRFAVAYGLSFPEYDIGEMKPPNEIPNILRDEKPKYSMIEYVSKDMV